MSDELEHVNETTVGTLLRASRHRRDEELREVSQILRVRLLYLEAIEEARYDDLPGKAYVIGFIRAYAEHLGLDSEEVVRRYKVEVSGDRNSAQLVFPSPIPESGVPGGAILFIGVAVAIMAYGGWYVSSTQDGFLTDFASPIPDRLASMSKDGKKKNLKEEAAEPVKKVSPVSATASKPLIKKPENKQQDEAQPTPPKLETSTSGAVAPDSVASGSGAPEKTKPADTPVASTAKKVEIEKKEVAKVQEAPKPIATPAVEPPKEAKPPVEGNRSASDKSATDPALQTTVTKVKAEDTPSLTVQPAAEQTPEVKKPSAQQVAAVPSAEGKSRILVRAKDDSWILIRDGGSNQLLTRKLLRAGETYSVPNRPGLTLQAGNAGALEISVDGETVPAIGAVGAVLRSVALDADRLREGKAVAP
jgi:cytoskeleton protein RodZ